MNVKRDKLFKKRDNLINTALEEFSHFKYDNVSLSTILEKANVSKGDFYYHYKNKDELYIDVVGVFLEKKKDFILNNIGKYSSQSNFFDYIENSIKIGLDFGKANPLLYSFSEMLFKEKGNAIYNKVFEHFKIENDEFLTDIINKAVQSKEIRKDIPTEVILSIIKHILFNVNDLLVIDNITNYESKIKYLIMFLRAGLGS